jgi:hypothetical protein
MTNMMMIMMFVERALFVNRADEAVAIDRPQVQADAFTDGSQVTNTTDCEMV